MWEDIQEAKDIIFQSVGKGLMYLKLSYYIVSIVFLFWLNNLNSTLMSKYSENDAFGILGYNNYQPLLFFAIDIILVIVGVYITYRSCRNILEDLEYLFEIGYLVFIIIVGLLIVGFLIHAITIPILKAIVTVIVSCGIIGFAMNSKN